MQQLEAHERESGAGDAPNKARSFTGSMCLEEIWATYIGQKLVCACLSVNVFVSTRHSHPIGLRKVPP